MAPDHWSMLMLDVVTGLSLAWSAGRLRTGLQQDRAAILAALQLLQDANERSAQMVRAFPNR